MKRRSMRGDVTQQNIQSILFNKSSSRTTIVPESPLVNNIASVSGKMSVLETPDTILKKCGLQRILEAENSDFSSEDFISSPELFCNRKKTILGHSSTFGLSAKSDGIVKKSRKTVSPSTIIFPFDVNDKEEIEKKLSKRDLISTPRNKSLDKSESNSPIFKRNSVSSCNKSNAIVKDKMSRAIQCLNSSNQSFPPSPRINNSESFSDGMKSPLGNFPFFQFPKSPYVDLDAPTRISNVPDTQPAASLILDGVVAYVDVRSGNENRSMAIKEFAESIGAEVVTKFTSRVTHLIFKEGSKSTFERATNKGVHLVSTLWLNACHTKGTRVPESQYPATFSNPNNERILPIRYRKPKSMQPLPFEEQEQLADARLKKRLKNVKCSSTSDESSSNTPIRVQELQHASSRQAIKDFLSPRSGRMSSSSTENWTDSDEEMHTPLRERMFQKIFKERVPLSPLAISNENRQGDHKKSIISPANSIDIGQNEKVLNYSSQNTPARKSTSKPSKFSTSRRRSQRIAQISQVRCDIGKLFESPVLSINPSSCRVNGESSTNYDNSSMDLTTSDSVFVFESEASKTAETLLTTSAGASTSRSCNGLPEASNHCSTSNTSLKTASMLAKRHRLHTVDVDQPSQDLIVPNTPDSPEKIPSSFYDSLMNIKSQPSTKLVKNGPKINIQKLKASRRSTRGGTPIALSDLEAKTSTSTVSGVDRTVDSTTTQAMETSTANSTPRQLRPRKLSILPQNRCSLDEFLPRNGHKRPSTPAKETHKSASICFTSISSRDIPNLMAIVQKLKGFRTVKSVVGSTTHVVCGSERRTLNVIRGITKGCWILDVSWLYESLDLEEWAPEEPFELFNFCPGAKISRMAKMMDPPTDEGFLCDFGRICVTGTTDPPATDLKDILKSLGATITSTSQHADLVIGRKLCDRNPTAMYIHEKWLLDCIQHWRIFPPGRYQWHD